MAEAMSSKCGRTKALGFGVQAIGGMRNSDINRSSNTVIDCNYRKVRPSSGPAPANERVSRQGGPRSSTASVSFMDMVTSPPTATPPRNSSTPYRFTPPLRERAREPPPIRENASSEHTRRHQESLPPLTSRCPPPPYLILRQ
ncbi:hypothetical protein CKAH01_00449 [Colletotrichum kahawae]|uniref:Uncharacterized protein n=1 Tax=Colletotrichum kahawae TaxID=34407 RepID=A0AAE0DEK9_COLKA|nr:hypothetical protein CKAH01_00449 [Colletotrichum kahawae]